jgi:hypothetical protein
MKTSDKLFFGINHLNTYPPSSKPKALELQNKSQTSPNLPYVYPVHTHATRHTLKLCSFEPKPRARNPDGLNLKRQFLGGKSILRRFHARQGVPLHGRRRTLGVVNGVEEVSWFKIHNRGFWDKRCMVPD